MEKYIIWVNHDGSRHIKMSNDINVAGPYAPIALPIMAANMSDAIAFFDDIIEERELIDSLKTF